MITRALLQRLGAAARAEDLGEEGGGDGGDGGRLGRASGPEEPEGRLVELARVQQRGEDRRRALEHLRAGRGRVRGTGRGRVRGRVRVRVSGGW